MIKEHIKRVSTPFVALVMLYITTLLICITILYKTISFSAVVFSVGAIVFPFLYIISIMITEIYGFKAATRVIFISFICEILFSIILYLLTQIPSPHIMNNADCYHAIIDPLPKITISNALTAIIGAYIAIYTVAKLKIITKGKYFWVRCILSALIAQLVFSFLAFSIYFENINTISNFTLMLFVTYIIKVIYITILSIPANYLIFKIKKIDNINIFDHDLVFNPIQNIKQVLSDINKKFPTFLTFLLMLYTTILMVSILIVYKVVKVGVAVFSVGTFIFPFLYIISDIIAEVYGFKTAKKLVIISFICELGFAFVLYLLAQISSNCIINNSACYHAIIDPLPRIALTNATATIVGSFINVYLISKWKLMTKGKYFWLRSICSSLIGEAIFTVIAFSVYFAGKVSLNNLIVIVLSTYFIKIIYAAILAGPANILTNKLKEINNTKNIDHDLGYNPFQDSK